MCRGIQIGGERPLELGVVAEILKARVATNLPSQVCPRGGDSIPRVPPRDFSPAGGWFDENKDEVSSVWGGSETRRHKGWQRKLLKPSGIFFRTTGNSGPFSNRLLRWSYYVVPEVHISFFELRTLALCLTKTGFEPDHPGLVAGFEDIIQFKVLKALGGALCSVAAHGKNG